MTDTNQSTALQGRNPRTGGPIGDPVPETPPEQLRRVVGAAVQAFETWRDTPREARAAALESVADALDANTDELAALADGAYRGIVIEPADATHPDLRRINRPLGPVAVFSASNFPFAFSVAGGDTASALAAGCPVVVKAHEAHPGTSRRTAELVASALAASGAPDGVFDIVYGFEAGSALVNHPGITAVGFTGSTRGGLALAAACAARPRPIPFYGELGSVNPVFVLPGAAATRAEEIASGYAASLTQGVGQFCTNPGLLFVPSDERLLAAIADSVTGTTGGPMLAERIHAGFTAGAGELAARPEVRTLAEGKPGEGPWSATPVVYTVTAEEFLASAETLREEHFGPLGLVITYAFGTGPDPFNLLDLGAVGEGHLTATIHLDPENDRDMELARLLTARLRDIAGRLVFNDWPTGVAVTQAQHHSGPYPATTAPAHTSVGAAAIHRWQIPTLYQNCPPPLLPPDLRNN